MNIRLTDYDRQFSRDIRKLLIPIVIQNLLSAAISSTDVIMLNYVGQSAISAVSLAGNYAGWLFSLFFGLGTGATTLCAQYYGKGDFRAIQTVQGIALRFSILIAGVVALGALLIPETMMLLFTGDPELIAVGASYLRVMSIAYMCWSIVEIYLSVLRSIGQATICLVLNIGAFVLNIVLNATFIFGLFGAPKLGAAGVAWATAISRLAELVGCFLVSAFGSRIRLDLRYVFTKNKALFGDFVKLAIPATGNDISWGVAFSMYSVILGHMGNDAVAANSLVLVMRNLSTVFCFGVASAGGILVGNVLGTGNLEKGRAYGSAMVKMTVLSGVVGGIIVAGAIPAVMRFAAVSFSETARHYLKVMLLINIYYIMGVAVNTSLIAGIFRAGGDTRFGLICDTIDMWCYAVPLGFFAAFVLKLPVLWVYFLLCTDEFVKWPWVFKRYRSGIWVKDITRDNLF